jgi:hypothetical protein
MDGLQHLFPRDTGQVYPYQYTGKVRTPEFAFPRRDVVPHSQALLEQIAKAQEQSKTQNSAASSKPDLIQRVRVSNYETRELTAIIQ